MRCSPNVGLTVVFFAAIGEVAAMERGAGSARALS